MRTRRRSLKAVVKGQGRSFVWLAAQTGYSTTQISRVARGEHPGSTRFHIAMRSALGEDYARMTQLSELGRRGCQCVGCERLFWGVPAFDAHRIGTGEARRCANDAEMAEGWAPARRTGRLGLGEGSRAGTPEALFSPR